LVEAGERDFEAFFDEHYGRVLRSVSVALEARAARTGGRARAGDRARRVGCGREHDRRA
jgi:hypothetical protein